MGDLHVHVGKVSKGSIKVGDNVNLEIDVKRRKDAKAYHSATHLLHEALRRTLGKHVTQKGSLVSPEKLRFDFSHNKPIEKSEITKIENLVNDMVSNSSDVKTRIMTPKEAVDNGALALFGEKYGDEVRVLSMGHENKKYFSTELCGGTHVANTAEIGKFKIISQSSIASGVRRVEALRADQLEEYEKNLNLCLQYKPTIKTHSNVIMHIFGFFSKEFSDLEKEKFFELLGNYKDEKITIGEILSEIHPIVFRFNKTYLSSQTYFLLYANPEKGNIFKMLQSNEAKK